MSWEEMRQRSVTVICYVSRVYSPNSILKTTHRPQRTNFHPQVLGLYLGEVNGYTDTWKCPKIIALRVVPV